MGGIVMLANQSPANPMGEDWVRLVAHYLATKTMRDRVLGETSGEGTTGVDDRYASAYFVGIGAEILSEPWNASVGSRHPQPA